MAALNIYMRILLAGTGIYTLTNFKVRVDCDVVGIMSRCLSFTSSGANERPHEQYLTSQRPGKCPHSLIVTNTILR